MVSLLQRIRGRKGQFLLLWDAVKTLGQKRGRKGVRFRRQAQARETPSWGRKHTAHVEKRVSTIYHVPGPGLELGCKDGYNKAFLSWRVHAPVHSQRVVRDQSKRRPTHFFMK